MSTHRHEEPEVGHSWEASQDQNVLLLSLAEIEGPSVFTRCETLLLPISSPCNRPSWSCCNNSENVWELAPSRECLEMLDWEEWNCWNGVFWLAPPPGCCENNDDGAYCMWIPRLSDSPGFVNSPVAILSLSTSCFSVSFKAACVFTHAITNLTSILINYGKQEKSHTVHSSLNNTVHIYPCRIWRLEEYISKV